MFRIVLLCLGFASLTAQGSERLSVAVASNFHTLATEIATRFSDRYGIPVGISSGSTGSLYAQIVNGAPYDVFLAADTERPELLLATELAVANSKIVYAAGSLVILSVDRKYLERDCLSDFNDGDFSRLAIANPATAPYGMAAKRYLLAQGRWAAMTDKLVFGENISQVFQFVATGNATFGLVAASQVIGRELPASSCWHVLPAEHAGLNSIEQAGVVLNRSKSKAAAIRFMRFLQSAEITSLLQQRGYGVPATVAHPES